jgi:hypothetical protein
MKTLSIILSFILSTSAFATDGKCKVGIDTDGLNDAQTAVVQSMAKQLEALGCTVGAPESHVTSAPSSITDSSNSASACAIGQVPTAQYGCITSAGACTVPGMNVQGVIYNNTCVSTGYSANAAYTGYYPTSCTTGQFAVLVGGQVACLSQGSCLAGQAFYNGQCYNLSQQGYGGYGSGRGFYFHFGY